MTSAQFAIWVAQMLDPENPAYNIGEYIEISGAIDPTRLGTAIRHAINQTDTLHLRFVDSGNGPRQCVCYDTNPVIPFFDLTDEADPDAAAKTWMHDDMARANDLSLGPLYTIAILKINANRFIYYHRFHHIVSDGFSISLFARNVADFYSALDRGLAAETESVGSWLDILADEKNYRNSSRYERDRKYWLNQLKDWPRPASLSGKPLFPNQSREFIRSTAYLAYPVAEALRTLGASYGASLAQIVTAAAVLYLHRFTGERDLIIGMPASARIGAKIRNIPGMISNALPLRFIVDPEQSFGEFLREATKSIRNGFRHQRYRNEDLRNDLGLLPNESSFYSMIVNILSFDYVQSFGSYPAQTHNLSTGPQFDISINVYDHPNASELRFDLDGNPFYYTKECLRIHLHRLQTIMTRLATIAPGIPLNQLNLLDAKERHTLLYEWNATVTEYPKDRCVHEMFEEQAAKTPKAVGVVWNGTEISYAELNTRANRLARHLRRQGVGPDSRVAICVERGPTMLIAILGILKAGGAYVPLDPEYPRERLAFMLADSAPVALLVESGLIALFREQTESILTVLLDAPARWAEESAENLNRAGVRLTSAHMAYVIYTSGSTGQPKGVMVEHRTLINHMAWMCAAYPLTAQDRMLSRTSLSFDAAVWEIWLPLLSGAAICLASKITMQDPRLLIDYAVHHGITIAQFVPTLLSAVFDAELLKPGRLRLLCCGGEPLSLQLAHKVANTWQIPLINLYGPTEATIQATHYRYREENSSVAVVPIGRPIANTRIYILDAHSKPVPIGATGEIYIGGAGVARGYLNRPEITAERFVADPFAEEPGARMYRTGDLGRWRPDGNIEFLGRNDFQVKLRGFRIEPREIERALCRYPGVGEAVVLARTDEEGTKRLVAYYTGENAFVADELRTHLASLLPEHMVPTAFVFLDALPLTANGKLDRKAFPAPEGSAYSVRVYEAPQDEIESGMARIWSKLLRVERVGRHDHFFELGGNSLLAVQMISQLRRTLGREAALTSLFAHPVLANFADSLADAGRVEPPPILPADRNKRLRLSFAQQRLWFIAQLEGASEAYHIPAGVRLRGNLNIGALGRALDTIVARHEALRTAFVQVDGDPEQRILPPEDSGFQLIEHDLRGCADAEGELQGLTKREALDPFDLTRGPLVRGRLIRLRENEFVLLITLHHIVSDGWSIGIFWRELGALYRAYRQDEPVELPELPIQYADYAAWQRHWLKGTRLHDQAEYWRCALAGAPALLEVPADRPRPAQQNYVGGYVPMTLDSELTKRVRALSQRHGATLFMTLLASWALLLARLSGQRDVVVGVPVANRGREEIEGLIGFFVNILALRVDLAGTPTVAELLARIKQRALDAQAHQDIPFEQVVDILKPPRNLAYAPLFQTLFAWQNVPERPLELSGLKLTPVEFPHATSRIDLTLAVWEEDGAIVGGLEYSSALFEYSTVERYLDYWRRLLDGMANGDDQEVGRLPLLGETERQRILVEWNATEKAYPKDRCVHELFETQSAKTPDAVAIKWKGGEMSYAELNTRANRLTRRLRDLGVRPRDCVAILLERSANLVIAELAILKCGGVYVPLDPGSPSERLAFMISDCAAKIVFTAGEAILPRLSGVTRVGIDETKLFDGMPDNPNSALDSEAAAYVMYTSGSTGQPKGVVVPHRAIGRLVLNNGYAEIGAGDRVAFAANPAFDAATFEVWAPLLNGGCIVLIEKADFLEPARFALVLEKQSVTTLFVTTALFIQYASTIPEAFGRLRFLLTGGERSDPASFARLLAGNKPRHLIHCYGPTETTTFTTTFEVIEVPDSAPSIPIGRPIANTRIYILDAYREPVPVGVSGELYIAGPGLALGYLDRPELTAERFVVDPFAEEPGARMYRTGDLGRWRPDGNIEFLGRNDFQVKLRGFRIEPGEIESCLCRFPGIREAVVLTRADGGGDNRLVAYYTGQEACGAEPLRAHLAASLPEYMVPAAFVFLDALPLTPNGKVNRKALPAPEASAHAVRPYEAPQGEIEAVLAGIWSKLLRIKRVGRHDNFFELGGNSLLAVQALDKVEKILKITIGLPAFFSSPTAAEMATVLGKKLRGPLWHSVVSLKTGTFNLPIFAVHYIPSSRGYALVRRLSDKQPLYALRYAIGVNLKKSIALPGIESLAAHYIEEMQLVQPEGPYFLFGFSFGGLVAYEMAQQLRQDGHKIGLAAMVDTFIGDYPPRPSIKHKIEVYGALRPIQIAKRMVRALRNRMQSIWQRLRYGTGYLPYVFLPNESLEVAKNYTVKPYPGRMLLFLAAGNNLNRYDDSLEQRWRKLLGTQLEIVRYPGAHDSIFDEPNVQVLAEKLQSATDEAES